MSHEIFGVRGGQMYREGWQPGVQPCVEGLISRPGFFLDLGKARLLVNSSLSHRAGLQRQQM